MRNQPTQLNTNRNDWDDDIQWSELFFSESVFIEPNFAQPSAAIE